MRYGSAEYDVPSAFSTDTPFSSRFWIAAPCYSFLCSITFCAVGDLFDRMKTRFNLWFPLVDLYRLCVGPSADIEDARRCMLRHLD
jgi:hypothetical protein